MQEKGLIQKFYDVWWKSGNVPRDTKQESSNAKPLKVENVGGIFVVLIGGLMLAVFVSLFEFIYYAKRNSKRINVSDAVLKMLPNKFDPNSIICSFNFNFNLFFIFPPETSL
jgi:hypothetical protein